MSKGKIAGCAIVFILIIASIVSMIIKRDIDVKLLIQIIVLLLLEIGAVLNWDSNKEGNEKEDSRTESAVNRRLIDIFGIIITVFIAAGMITYKITGNINVIIMIIPLLVLFAMFLPLYGILHWYYWRKYRE